jgi:hypothetical protein
VFAKEATIFGVEYLATQSDIDAKNNLVYLKERFSKPSGDGGVKEILSTRTSNKYTCKIEFPSTIITSQCFPAGTTIVFAQEFESGGVKYLKTRSDVNNGLGTVFLAERFEPDASTSQPETPPRPSGDGTTTVSYTKTSLRYTCKISYPTIAITDQCFNAPLTVVFSQEIVSNGTRYLKTQHDFNHGFDTVFLAERFQ